MRSLLEPALALVLGALLVGGCGGAAGGNAPGSACDESSIDDALACQAAPGTDCHTCINPHGPGAPTTFIGYCVYSCNPSAPSCPAGQTCSALPDDTGWLSRGCAAELTGYCH